MTRIACDIAIIGSGAGGGAVAQELSALCREKGVRILVLEKGPKLDDAEFTGREHEMAECLYEDGGGFLTAERTMTLAFGRVYGGSTAVYTGTSLLPTERVIRRWNVPGVEVEDLCRRASKFSAQNNVHLVHDAEINDNNRFFVDGCRRLGYRVEQFPVNVKGCRGSSLCNLGCPNGAKQGTDRVQLPAAERNGVEVVTRCDVQRIGDRCVLARVSAKSVGEKGQASTWAPGDYEIAARFVIVAAGAVNSPALLLRSGFRRMLPRLGHGFTVHPAFILVAEHERPITNFVGHPKSFYLDQFAEADRFVLETCMYFPFVTAKSLTGFGPSHSSFMRAFPRLQMILVLACDRADAHNRVMIDSRERPVVHYRFTEEVARGLVRGGITSARIFFAAGARRVHIPFAQPAALDADHVSRLDDLEKTTRFRPEGLGISAAHLQGGCGMGRTATDSVTDAWGRVHGLDWLYVADASLFPNALEINPYLTIMALADRVAENVRERLS